MEKEKKSFQPDGTVEQHNTLPENSTPVQRQAPEEKVAEQKDERQSYQDYNGNSEANAPARAREE